jgi:biotin carboxyl carrier protein
MESEKDLKSLVIQGALYKTKYTKKFENREVWEAPDQNKLHSFMPGTIIDIFVKPKEKVKEGQTLLLLDAMKMLNQVRMPFDGEIVEIFVKKGEAIPNHHMMLEIKPL